MFALRAGGDMCSVSSGLRVASTEADGGAHLGWRERRELGPLIRVVGDHAVSDTEGVPFREEAKRASYHHTPAEMAPCCIQDDGGNEIQQEIEGPKLNRRWHHTRRQCRPSHLAHGGRERSSPASHRLRGSTAPPSGVSAGTC
eukprot:1628591-Rhodomonas_salina.4